MTHDVKSDSTGPKTSVVVIPTKNRLSSLQNALNSLLRQTHKPDVVLVIDQSDLNNYNSLSHFNLVNGMNLNYHYKPELLGLVEAKKYALDFCTNYEILFFIEDDVVLEENYIYEGISAFLNNSNMIGCTGYDLNSQFGLLYSIFHKLLYSGDFSDSRPILFYLTRLHLLQKCVPTSSLSGGISAFRTDFLVKTGFDTENFFHFIEDKVISFRLQKAFGYNCLYYNPKMKLVHNTLRSSDYLSRVRMIEKTVIECKLFYTVYLNKTLSNIIHLNFIVFRFFIEINYLKIFKK